MDQKVVQVFLWQQDLYILGGFFESTFQTEDQGPQTFNTPLFFDTNIFKSDNLEDGGMLSGYCPQCIYILKDAVESTDQKISLQVSHVEEILFQNLRSESTNGDADDNPFVEYSIAPNNFLDEGAFGVFAGFQLTEVEIELDAEKNP